MNESKNKGTLDEMKKRYVKKALKKTQGNQAEACKLLGITKPTMRKLIKMYKIDLKKRGIV